MSNESNASIYQIVQYSVQRAVNMVKEVSESGEQLLQPELLEKWLPDSKNYEQAFKKDLYQTVLELKKNLSDTNNQTKYNELLDFVQDELLESKHPRRFVLESALRDLRANETLIRNQKFEKLENLIVEYFEKPKTR